jgi:uncharacterized membrane protein
VTANSEDPQVLKKRLHDLEREVAEIQGQLNSLNPESPPASAATPPPIPDVARQGTKSGSSNNSPGSSPAAETLPQPAARKFQPEVWVARLGIGLLLLGVLFLFQYALDQDWLGPWLRVGFGVVLGFGLLIVGIRLESAHDWFKHLLLGGALATWYVTVYASNRIYELIPGSLALTVVLFLACIAYLFSLREQSAAIAGMATAGGLLSPLLLIEGASVSAEELLFLLILSTAAMVYYCRRGGTAQPILVFILGGLILVEAGEGNGSLGARIFIQMSWLGWGGLLLSAAWWRQKLLSHATRKDDTDSKSVQRFGWLAPEKFPANDKRNDPATDSSHWVYASAMGVLPLVWFIATSGIWNLPKQQGGWLALVLAISAYAGRMALLQHQRNEEKNVKSAVTESTSLLGILLFHSVLFGLAAVIMILDGSPQLFVISLVGWTLIEWSIRTRYVWFRLLGNILFSGALFWTLIRVVDAIDAALYPQVATVQCWVNFWVIALAVGQSALSRRKGEALIYWFPGISLLLLWMAGVVSGYENGGPVLTLLWSVVMVVCLVAGLTRKRALWNATSVALLLLVLGKLFIVDLASVESFWRVLLFLLLGLILLVASYLIASNRKKTEPPSKSENPPELPPLVPSGLDKPPQREKIDARP